MLKLANPDSGKLMDPGAIKLAADSQQFRFQAKQLDHAPEKLSIRLHGFQVGVSTDQIVRNGPASCPG